MVKFDYAADGRIIGVCDTFSAFNEPSAPISAEVTALTGITDEMVVGHKFDEGTITAFVEGAIIVIAHNSGFDRRTVKWAMVLTVSARTFDFSAGAAASRKHRLPRFVPTPTSTVRTVEAA